MYSRYFQGHLYRLQREDLHGCPSVFRSCRHTIVSLGSFVFSPSFVHLQVSSFPRSYVTACIPAQCHGSAWRRKQTEEGLQRVAKLRVQPVLLLNRGTGFDFILFSCPAVRGLLSAGAYWEELDQNLEECMRIGTMSFNLKMFLN